MADQQPSDLIMILVGDQGPIDGEASTVIQGRKKDMTAGFQTGKMFEVRDFSVQAGLKGSVEDEATEKMLGNMEKMGKHLTKQIQKMAQKGQAGQVTDVDSMSSRDFSEFRTGTDGTPYPVDIRPVKFTRNIDQSSAVVMRYCINRKTFKSASIIKRRAAGGQSSGEVFLRIDFNTVLITNIEWENDDPIEETIEFVCRAIRIRYLPQLPDGTLGAAIPAFWTADPSITETSFG